MDTLIVTQKSMESQYEKSNREYVDLVIRLGKFLRVSPSIRKIGLRREIRSPWVLGVSRSRGPPPSRCLRALRPLRSSHATPSALSVRLSHSTN